MRSKLSKKVYKVLIIFFLSFNSFIFEMKNTFIYIYKVRHISLEKELINIQKYMDNIFNLVLLDKGKKFYPTENPKISVIISVFNGEGYLRTSLLSIQNQDLKDIEIIMVDDCSVDNSVNLIKELMIKEPRIVFYQNNETRGALFTKTKGVLLAKGKYILILDEDDMYVQRDAFSTLYYESEKYNLDLLNYIFIMSQRKLNHINFTKREYPIIYQPEISEKVFKHYPNGKIQIIGGVLHNYFIKKNLFVKIIKQIDEKYFKIKMNQHDDILLVYLLTRNAYNYKKIDRIFHIYYTGWDLKDKNIKYNKKEKKKIYPYIRCSSLLNFIEFILENTDDNFYDKQIAFYSMNKWFLSYFCRNFTKTREQAINISNLYLKNKYIQEEDKKKIRIFLKQSS